MLRALMIATTTLGLLAGCANGPGGFAQGDGPPIGFGTDRGARDTRAVRVATPFDRIRNDYNMGP